MQRLKQEEAKEREPMLGLYAASALAPIAFRGIERYLANHNHPMLGYTLSSLGLPLLLSALNVRNTQQNHTLSERISLLEDRIRRDDENKKKMVDAQTQTTPSTIRSTSAADNI